MQTLILPGVKVRSYDSPHKLPESQRVGKDLATLQRTVGSTMQDVDRLFTPIVALVELEQPELLVGAIIKLQESLLTLLAEPSELNESEPQILTAATVDLYESPQHLPEYQRSLFSYYQSIHYGIGSTLLDVNRHFEPMLLLASANDTESLMTAVNNIRFLFYSLLNKQLAHNLLALCCLVKSVNGQEWTDYTEKGLERLVLSLGQSGLCQEHAKDVFDMYGKEILKPLIREFPVHFSDNEQERQDYIQLVLLWTLDKIRNPNDETLESRRKSLEADAAEQAQPQLMAGRGNIPDAIKDAYQKNKFLLLTENLPVDDQTTSYTFWSFMSNLQAKYRRQSAQYKEKH